MATDRQAETRGDGAAADAALTPAERARQAGARARAEAEARRAQAAPAAAAREIAGRGGLDPVRYEEWEIKGLAADF